MSIKNNGYAKDNERPFAFHMRRLELNTEHLVFNLSPILSLSSEELSRRLNDISEEIKRDGGHFEAVDGFTYDSGHAEYDLRATEESIRDLRDSALRVFSKSGVNRVSYIVVRAGTSYREKLDGMAAYVRKLMRETLENINSVNVNDRKSPVEAIYVEDGKVMVLRSGKWEIETGNVVSEFIRLSSK